MRHGNGIATAEKKAMIIMKSGLTCGYHGGGGYCNNLTLTNKNEIILLLFIFSN
jgi:hypothetical protein